VSGTTPPGSPPPEVPEEFAAAYRAAYEQALAAQSEGLPEESELEGPESGPESGAETDPETDTSPGTDTDELPARRGRLVVGTHRTEAYDDEPTLFERVSDSPWFVPLLLALLALLLVLGAYAVGRAFSGKVNSDSGPSSAPRVVLSESAKDMAYQPVTTPAR
jgi:hypothetical protein